jgi:hypothetical protein
VLDLVQPLAAGRQFHGFGWEAGAMNPAGRVRCNMRRQIELGRDDCNLAEPGDKRGVGQLAMTGRPAGRGKSRPVAPWRAGALPAIHELSCSRSHAFPDLCLGIVSERLEFLWTLSPLD